MAADALLTSKQIQIIDQKEFVKVALDPNQEAFVIYVLALKATEMTINLFRAAQIIMLLAKEAPTKVLSNYSDYSDAFSPDLAIKLPDYKDMNAHAIKLEKSKQPPYSPIYSLGLIEMESLKIYIETYLKTRFIRPSKSSAGALILFNQKPNGSLRFCVDYRGLNNLTIKN